jgi:hypothetical protein
MTKIINLDELETKRDKVVVLGGKEHVMATLTVQDYINQLKQQRELEKLTTSGDDSPETADRIVELTVDAMHKLFPTIERDQLMRLNLDQLNAMRALADEYTAEDAPDGELTGESTGKA